MRSHLTGPIAIAALLASLLAASVAQAAPKEAAGAIGGVKGTSGGEFAFASGVAVNQSSGDVYVFDAASITDPELPPDGGGQRVQQFNENGDFVRAWGWGVATGSNSFEVCTSTCRQGIAGSGEGQFSNNVNAGERPQIAIDQSDGSVYVADAGNDRVQKFSATGAYLGQFGDEGIGTGQFNRPSGVAVDPVSGDVYVADTDNNRIQRFDSDGNHLSSLGTITGGSGEGEFVAPTRVVVDSNGRLYVLDSGNGRIQRFTDTGVFDGFFASGALGSAEQIGIDTSNDHVLVRGYNLDFSARAIYELAPDGSQVDVHARKIAGFFPEGIAIHSSTGRIYAANAFEVVFFEEVNEEPTVSIGPVTDIGTHSATFTGLVNPEGPPITRYQFEYSPDGVEWNRAPEQAASVGQGSTDITVSRTVTGLEANTEYRVRLFARKDFGLGSATSAEVQFTTEAAAPLIDPLYPGPVDSDSAWLGAWVNAQNSETTFHIEYATIPDFSSSGKVPAGGDASAGSGGSFVLATRRIDGLLPNTTYHYRVRAANTAGMVVGQSRTFTTHAAAAAAGLPDERVWEKVSPSYKAGANINAGNFSNGGIFNEKAQAAVDGDAVAYGSYGKFAAAEGGPGQSQYLARRTATGWSTEAINVPMDPVPDLLGNLNYFQWLSNDLSNGITVTMAALNPGDPKDVYNVYLRDNVTGEVTTVSANDGTTPKRSRASVSGVSADGQHFVFYTQAGSSLDDSILMERRSDGTLHEVSLVPGEGAVPGNLGSGLDRLPGFNAVSADGSRIFFATSSGVPEVRGRVYVRENGTTTVPLSASERTDGTAGNVEVGDFLGAAADGSVAFFRSPASLTDDTPPADTSECPDDSTEEVWSGQICHLYRWDSAAPVGERLTNISLGDPRGAQVLGMVGVSDDGGSAYFAAFGNLDGNGSANHPNLYLWRQGEGVRFIARLAGGAATTTSDVGLWSRRVLTVSKESKQTDNNEPYKPARVTPDGRYIAFATHVPQVAYDSNGLQSIYVYDSGTGRITCVSCGMVEAKSKGDSWFVSCSAEEKSETKCDGGSTYLTHNFRPDGQRLIFESKDALVPTDTNGVTDVYQWQDGKLHLISSGTSAVASRFVDASTDGDDIFFTTAQQLTPSDRDSLRDLYDARVGGQRELGVKPPCVADECQGTPRPAPAYQSPSSPAFTGPGDLRQGRKARCRKGKVRRKGRCVTRRSRSAKRAKKNVRRAAKHRGNNNRRAGR